MPSVHATRLPKVMLGLSGGVDSSVAALLLKKSGYPVTGVFMRNWDNDNDAPHARACQSDQDLMDARAIATQLDIPFHVVNFSQRYWDEVFTYFLDELAQGRTPNPDILCNSRIKFRAFLDYAHAQGAQYIATGHYARIAQHQAGHYALLTAKDPHKDQTYFLHALHQSQLAHALFPLGHWEKPAVRALARELGFQNHDKKDSTGICFIGERRFSHFLKDFLICKPGPICNIEDGKPIGQHTGLICYTIGQRQGLGIGGLADKPDAPWYVVKKDMPTQTLWVAQGSQHPALLTGQCIVPHVHWINPIAMKNRFQTACPSLTCQVKIRYRHAAQDCQLTRIDSTTPKDPHHHCYRVTFHTPQRAVAPGQYAVFYQNEHCLGGGAIA